jgi:hypothetical protein
MHTTFIGPNDPFSLGTVARASVVHLLIDSSVSGSSLY